ncbi:MAG: DNA-directed RNA polymerase subunit beta [Barrevirus sp.]|uniref:DNA-directed RNA polymerase n=1 Tax=Barrevirus sp. TaxID=2487763 RepID=A0A3G4ZQY4_9VIRU|nr:MAG: DNA-directed RNA polymerase subunit beta [Barrevirus sp.]
MREARKLKIDDLVVVKHTQKYLELNKETKFMIKSDTVCDQYKLDLLKLGLLDRYFKQEELEIMARLVGANITDGHLYITKETQYYGCCFSLGEPEDAYDLVDDIMRLGFSCPAVNRATTHFNDAEHGKHVEYKTYKVEKNGAFAYFMFKIGAFAGDKTEQARKLPEWLTNGNNRIMREFLSGFIGGDGCRISAQKKKNAGHAIAMGSLGQTTITEHLQAAITYMQSISNMCKELKIKTTVTHTKVKNEDKYQVWLNISNAFENFAKFVDIIGYRYCNEKKKKSALVIEYIKCKYFIMTTRQNKYNQIIEYANNKNNILTKKEMAEKIDIDLKMFDKIIRKYRTNGKITEAKSYDFMKYEDFASSYFEKNDIVTIPIESIVKIPPEPVYDFTTISSNHSFIANGIASSNCYIETSEGSKVGLVKNLSQIGNVTVLKSSQFDLLKGIIKQKVKNVRDIPINQFGKYTRVILNGEVIGLTLNPRKLYSELKEMKYNGTLDPLIGIAHDIRSEIECKDLRINCDTGRIYHPTIRVENNEINLTKDMIDLISEDVKGSAAQINSWNQFMMRFPGTIEYLDPDEKSNSMVAMYPKDVEEMRVRMVESVSLVDKLEEGDFLNILNRYDRFTYVKYTHCEIDPNLLIGVVVANIPFLECNQGPRNIYQYSQARQAMGIYATNYRDRLDISYILYHPQRPIVTTRSMKYINTDKIPSGENCIVAIAAYGGWNQEDSNFMSKAAIDFGLFRSTSVKKYMTTIQKNQSTSQDDIFIKPDRSQVAGMKHGSYDKLNEKGYAPEETRLENGDILIGKVSPIQAVGNSNKLFKDSSEHYKSHIIGTVDKVYTGIFNHEGYEMRKVRVRSERVPQIGDKYCSRSGQKGTNGIQLTASDMMFSNIGVSPDLIINTNAIPSRMTIGQLIECLSGKVAALSGIEIDGSGFSNFDLDDLKGKLKSLGFREDSTEFMRNGMTGKKMNIPIFLGPTYYQRLKHMVADKIHCLTLDHEVLTEQGWKTFDEITMNDKIATLKDGLIQYEKPLDLLYYPNFEGNIYKIKTKEVDLQVTDNHRMWVSRCINGQWQPFELIEANKIIGETVRYQNNESTTIEVNKDTIINEELFHVRVPVFCLQVPSEVFYVRRNRVEIWTGNSRARGPQTILTRQPPEGRARDGGLRLGEMERDSNIGHGIAKFLKERLLEASDVYHCYVCNQCGLFAQRMLRKDNKPYPTKKDIYYCQGCRNYTDISKIRIPYAFKLLIQELMAMNICPRIKTKKHTHE